MRSLSSLTDEADICLSEKESPDSSLFKLSISSKDKTSKTAGKVKREERLL